MPCRLCQINEAVGRGAYCKRCLDIETDGMDWEDVEAGAEFLDRLERKVRDGDVR